MLPWTDFGKWQEKGARRIDLEDGPRMVLISCLFMSNAVEMGNEKKQKFSVNIKLVVCAK